MSKLILRLFFLTFFLTALCWLIIIPLWQYPDEQAHFAQVQNIAESGKSPLTGKNTSSEIAQSEKIFKTERDENGNNSYTYHPEFNIEYTNNYFGHNEYYLANLNKTERKLLVKTEATSNPPLYYVASSIFYKIFYYGNLFDRVYSVRLLSAVFYLLTVLICYKIGRLTFESNLIAIYFTTFIGFMPMFIFSSTGVLPDSLTNLLFTLIIYFSTRLLKGIDKKTVILALITIFAGVLTRQHFLIAIPIFLTALSFRLTNMQKIKFLLISSVSIAILLIFIEKFATVYPIIGNFRISDISNLKPNLLFSSMYIDHIIWSLKHTYSEVLPWYWGVYRWLSLTLPHLVYQIINRMILVSIIGFLIYLIKIKRSNKINHENRIAVFMLTSLFIYFFTLLTWDYFFRLKNNFSFGFQGRYYFPLISAELLIIFIGFRQLAKVFTKKNFHYLLFILSTLMVIFSDFSLFFIASSYYDVTSLNTFLVQASQYKPLIIKGEVLYLILALTAGFQLIFIFSLGKATLKTKL